MRSKVLVSLMLVWGLVALSSLPRCEAQGWKELLPGLVDKIAGVLFENSEFEMLGRYCQFSMTPSFRRFELRYKGTVWCPGWTDIRGKADSSSRSGIIGKTIRDFLTKAVAAGVVTDAEVQEYLGKQ